MREPTFQPADYEAAEFSGEATAARELAKRVDQLSARDLLAYAAALEAMLRTRDD